MIEQIKSKIPYAWRLYAFRKKFHKKFQTKVFPANIFDCSCIKNIGRHSYGPIEVYTWGEKNEKLEIGNFVSIANDVTFVLGGNHPMNRLSTYPFALDFSEVPIERPKSKGPVTIEDDVWIGMKSMIMSGVTVHQGAVIMAGSVVTHDVPAYAVVGGVPAKVVKYRFENPVRQMLNEKLDWKQWSDTEIVECKEQLGQAIESDMQVKKILDRVCK